MADAVADGVVATVAARAGVTVVHGDPAQLAEQGTKIPRRGLTLNRALGREVPVAVLAIERAGDGQPWSVTVAVDGQSWVESVEGRYSRDEAVEVAWRVVSLRAAALRPAVGA